jgi:aspartate oxidase
MGRGIEKWRVRPPRSGEEPPEGMQVNLEDVLYSLKSLMWRQLGIEREKTAMRDADAKIALWTRAVRELGPPEPRTWELMNLLTLARLVATGARARQESRGVHFRTDFPEASEDWRVHTRLSPEFEEGRLVAARIEHTPVASAAHEAAPLAPEAPAAPVIPGEARSSS